MIAAVIASCAAFIIGALYGQLRRERQRADELVKIAAAELSESKKRDRILRSSIVSHISKIERRLILSHAEIPARIRYDIDYNCLAVLRVCEETAEEVNSGADTDQRGIL